MINKIEQGRASFAYECVIEACKDNEEFKKNYKSYVKRLPMLIKTNGLGQTLAFVKSKVSEKSQGKAYKLLYDQISRWLKEDQKHLLDLGPNDELIEKVINLDIEHYRYVTDEVLALLNWMRRFADGMIEGGE